MGLERPAQRRTQPKTRGEAASLIALVHGAPHGCGDVPSALARSRNGAGLVYGCALLTLELCDEAAQCAQMEVTERQVRRSVRQQRLRFIEQTDIFLRRLELNAVALRRLFRFRERKRLLFGPTTASVAASIAGS